MKTLLISLFLVIFLAKASNLSIYSPKLEKFVTYQEFHQEIEKVQMIFGGEYHDHDAGHELQLKLLQIFHQTKKNVTLALEMFERGIFKFNSNNQMFKMF
jgi:uncharacterized iron-regulated protein